MYTVTTSIQGRKVDVFYSIHGRHYRATYDSPEEFPIIDIEDITLYSKLKEEPLKIKEKWTEKIIEKYEESLLEAIVEEI